MADTYYNDLTRAEASGSSLNRMDMMVSAMWELMLEKGFTREQLNAKLDRIRDTNSVLDPKQNVVICPSCGKKVTEGMKTPFEGKCLYCGNVVTIYPGDGIDITTGEPKNASESSSDPILEEDAPIQDFTDDQDTF